jgi:hypothetical protein
MTSPSWTPYREPFRSTLLRTVTIALVAGTVLSVSTHGRVRWPIAVLVMLWPSLGGHFVEVWFLNWLRPRLSAHRSAQLGARLATWFAGGVAFAALMALTARALSGGGATRALAWWIGGLGFIAVELIAHLGLRARGRPSVYDGLG